MRPSWMASMRPGQLTPENENQINIGENHEPRFNEAGAINPGKLKCLRVEENDKAIASMRPGQLTPENVTEAGKTE